MRRLLIWGAGELGSRVARLWIKDGGRVIGFTQTDQRHFLLQTSGAEPKLGSPVNFLAADDVLLLALPGHQAQGDAVEQLRQQNVPQPQRAVLISLTGYYGASTGVIDETAPPGDDERSQSIAAVEQSFLRWAGQSGVVLRLGGLYSPERGPFSALAKRGKVLRLAPANKTMALIHYDDAATAVWAALGHPAPEPVYLGVTVPCPTRQEFYSLACHRLGLPQTGYTAPLPYPPVEYNIARLRRDLLPAPAYPDWRAAVHR